MEHVVRIAREVTQRVIPQLYTLFSGEKTPVASMVAMGEGVAHRGRARAVEVVAAADALLVQGSGRGGKPKEDMLKGVGFASHVGKRARKGKAADLGFKPVSITRVE